MRDSEPLYVISVASRLLQLHPQTLRKYEREGFVEPSRTTGNLRLYSAEDIDRLRQVKSLVEERGVNLAGVQMALRLTHDIRGLQSDLRSRKRNDYDRIADALDGLLEAMGASPDAADQPARVAVEVRVKRKTGPR
ncbi:MAG TPA: MerR family transcriptional regulator [Thermomicrobiales bacterium]|nr:MerR family transcriptional regulator [Thermomicrobiales bacterium]